MSQQPSGWYDDPTNPQMLRYWDGVAWTSHTTPKQSPTAAQSTIGRPPQPASDQQGQAQPNYGQAGPPPSSYPWANQPGQQGQQGFGQQGQYGAPQQPYPGASPYQVQNWGGPTTADGERLASFGQRVGAWIIDGFILLFIFFVLTSIFSPGALDEFRRAMDVSAAGDQEALNAASQRLANELESTVIPYVIASALYCIGFWTMLGQTPGKMAIGISIRREDRPGPPDLLTAVKRRLLAILQVLPYIRVVLIPVALLDYLWPLWDPKRQALHDKIAGTVVVVGKSRRQPPA